MNQGVANKKQLFASQKIISDYTYKMPGNFIFRGKKTIIAKQYQNNK